jgi:threonine dehydrogenase-like Zn-dependent dehydrogenase
MKAAAGHGAGAIRLDPVLEAGIQKPADAIVRQTGSAICGTDPHGRWIKLELKPAA